jgi:acyl carrier protein
LADEELKIFLKSFLPDYMIPSFFKKIETIPLLANGKIDFKTLPAIDLIIETVELNRCLNEIEERILSIWEDFLPVKGINIKENFFKLGGHSLSGVQVLTRIDNEYGTDLKLSALFDSPTIEKLADVVSDLINKKKTDEYEFGRI